jgi:hypothetical protein
MRVRLSADGRHLGGACVALPEQHVMQIIAGQ